jgi:Ca2+-transporting ATPase
MAGSSAAAVAAPSTGRGFTPHADSVDQCLRVLDTTDQGLDSQQARKRLAEHGPNVLPRGKVDGPLQLLWRQINNPLIWVLIASGGVAMAVDWDGEGIKNGLVIVAVVVLNSLIGFVQEYKAGKAIEALAKMVPQDVNVLRDGHATRVPAAELAPGDVVLLASGDKVPADLRLLSVKNLQIEEAALTGESVPTQKSVDAAPADAVLGDRTCMAYGGTLVTYGTGAGVVVATAADTELGRISNMLKQTTELQTPLTRAMATIGKQITIGIVAITLVMLAVGTWRTMQANDVPLGEALRETVIFGIALAVGAIPEGLPAIVTIALAIGVQRMARRRAVIRKLPAVETLGSTTVICSDKTGTLTRNEMTVQALWTPGGGAWDVSGVGYHPQGRLVRGGEFFEPDATLLDLAACAVLCNDATLKQDGDAWKITGDPTEAALVTLGAKLGLDAHTLRASQRRLDVIPFESDNQFMATLHAGGGDEGTRIVVKGAPEVLARRCEGLDIEAVHVQVNAMARRGMRVLAVAHKRVVADQTQVQMSDVAGGLRLLGLIGMIDPPRTEAIQAIEACHRAGITVKMITGDHHATAAAIGAQLGILSDAGAVSGAQLATCSDQDLCQLVARVNVFARVAPEHKLRLVRAIQANGSVVAMTGDGVNDAPALKQSDIGVAMGITGTAVSKEAADIVLTDDNFASIAAAVEEGRRVYDNLVKSLAFVLPTNLGLALILLCAVAFFPFSAQTGDLLLPLSPIQLLWINLVATVALALPLAFEAREPDVMSRPPRDPQAPVLSRFLMVRTAVVALLMAAGAIGLFQWEYSTELAAGAAPAVALAEAQTMAVTTIVLFQVFYLLNCRSLRDSIRAIGVFSNKVVFLGIAAILALQVAFVNAPLLNRLFESAPLNLEAWTKATLAAMTILPVISAEKWWLRRRDAARTREPAT